MTDPVAIIEGSLMIIGVFFAPILALLPGAKRIAEGLSKSKPEKDEDVYVE